MKINYRLEEIILRDEKDLERLKNFSTIGMYEDEFVINVFVENELILNECLGILEQIRFGMLRRLPLVNMYFNIGNMDYIDSLSNDIKNFITPILKVDYKMKNIIEEVSKSLCVFKRNGWELQILFDVNNAEAFEESIQVYNTIKCYFFEEEIYILYKLGNNSKMLKSAYLNINYIMDTIKFLGMRNNIIVKCLLKAIREKETGIKQDFSSLYVKEIHELMKNDIEKIYSKKTLVRATMDDFAMA